MMMMMMMMMFPNSSTARHSTRRGWKRRGWLLAVAVLVIIQIVSVTLPPRWVSPSRDFQCGLSRSGVWFWSLSSGEFTYAQRGFQRGADGPLRWLPTWLRGTATVHAGSNPPVTLAGTQASIPIYFFGIAALLLWMLSFIPTWRRHHRARKGLCFACGYDLRGQSSAPCPECGLASSPLQA